MATWYAVINSATGEALSFGTTIATPLFAGHEALPIDHQPGSGERWDAATRAVVAMPPDPFAPKRDRLATFRAKGWANLTVAEREEARGLVFDLGGSP